MLAKERKAISIKGFARPVRTFGVKGNYDELAAEGRVIHCHQNGLTLTIDQDGLNEADKAEAIQTLENALAQLKN